MISPDALVVAGATIAVLGLQQWRTQRQNRKQNERWTQLLSILLTEYPLHRHDKNGDISYPKVKLGSAINGKVRVDDYT